jgi:hypothetical protein
MDPLSITASCLAITGSIVKVSMAIASFTITYRETFQDLTAITGQLTQLGMIIDRLKDDSDGAEDIMPEALKAQIRSILDNCDDTIRQLSDVMQRYQGRTGKMKWALYGKEKVQGLNTQLSAHIDALHIALELSTL